jgi:hypothetical protein
MNSNRREEILAFIVFGCVVLVAWFIVSLALLWKR